MRYLSYIPSKLKVMGKGRPPKESSTTVVVYRKRKKGKAYMSVFKDINVDDLLNNRKHHPLIPDNFIIEEIGLGESLIETYKKTYDIKKIR